MDTRATAVLQTVRQGWNSFSDMGTALQQVPFSRLDLSTSQRSEFFRSLGLLYFIKFDDVLHEQSARSLYEAYDLALQTQELGLALQNVSDITPQFYAIVEQMEQLFNLIGDRSSGLRNALGDVCEYQASNKGIEHCRPSDF